jgi:hypothetical protein
MAVSRVFKVELIGDASDAIAEFKKLSRAGELLASDFDKKVFAGLQAGFNVAKTAIVAVTGAATVLGAAAFGAAQQASDLNETINKSRQIFGDAAGDIEKFASNAAQSLGQTKRQAIDAAATFGIFGKAAGLSGRDLSKFSTNFVTLASDLASFNNTRPEEAIEAIGAALRGESEPIRRFGVLLNDAALKAVAFEKGIFDGKGALTAQQKTLAATELIFRQTTDAQGDFERTSGGLANQLKILRASLQDVVTNIGQVLLPVFERFVSFINKNIVPALQIFADQLGEQGIRKSALLSIAALGDFGVAAIEGFRTATNAALDFLKTILLTFEGLKALQTAVNFFRGDLVKALRDFVGVAGSAVAVRGIRKLQENANAAFDALLKGAKLAQPETEALLKRTNNLSAGADFLERKFKLLVPTTNQAAEAIKNVGAATGKVAKAKKDAAVSTDEFEKKVKALESAQQRFDDATKSVTNTTKNLKSAQDQLKNSDDALTKAKDKLAAAIRGQGRDSDAAKRAARGVAQAQRDLERANLNVTDALDKQREAELKLQELRAKAPDARKVSDAEFDLEGAKIAVEEATLRVQQAEEDLAKTLADPEASPIEKRRAELDLVNAKRSLTEAILAVGDAETDLIAVRATGASAEEITEAERQLQEAKLSVQDAIERQTQATEDLNTANDEYRKITEGVRQGDQEFIDLTADVDQAFKERQEAAEDLQTALDNATEAASNLSKALFDLETARAGTRVPGVGDVPEFRAGGGSVSAGRPYIVGERGPELFVPGVSGNVMSNARAATTVNVVVNAGLGTSGIQVAQQIVDVLSQYTKVSGPLSQYVSV